MTEAQPWSDDNRALGGAVDLLIVGAGPSGLAAACRLVEAGHRPMIWQMRNSGHFTRKEDLVGAFAPWSGVRSPHACERSGDFGEGAGRARDA